MIHAALAGLIVGLLIAILATDYFPEYTNLYKRGQIDALNGKILNELKRNKVD